MALTGASLGPGLPRGRAPADRLRPARRDRVPCGRTRRNESSAARARTRTPPGRRRPSAPGGRMRIRLIPREERFFDMFVEDAANVLSAARHLEEMHALISGLDDVLDLIEEIADTFILYHVDAPTPASVQQATIIRKQCEAIHEALTKLQGFQGLQKYWIEIHRLENDGDRIARAAVAGLFSEKTKAIDMVKWKDIYALLEDCIDKCDDVANIMEKIVVKHAGGRKADSPG